MVLCFFKFVPGSGWGSACCESLHALVVCLGGYQKKGLKDIEGSFSRLFLRSEDVIQFQTCTEACPFGMVACGFQ